MRLKMEGEIILNRNGMVKLAEPRNKYVIHF